MIAERVFKKAFLASYMSYSIREMYLYVLYYVNEKKEINKDIV
jgi:hypothetical protein